MSDIILGYQKMTWRIIMYDSAEPVSEERIPLDQMDESALIYLLEAKAKGHLSEREIADSPSLYEVMTDKSNGRRLCYSAGKNPYYIASLWRSDQLAAE